jgi:hypothetical protein
MTQELIANLLGVRREGVTEAALKLQRAGAVELGQQIGRPHAVGLTAALHHGPRRRGRSAHEHRDADQTLGPDDRDLDRAAVLGQVQHRDHRGGQEVGVRLHHARLEQHLPERQLDPLEQRQQALDVGCGQRPQQSIAPQITCLLRRPIRRQ